VGLKRVKEVLAKEEESLLKKFPRMPVWELVIRMDYLSYWRTKGCWMD